MPELCQHVPEKIQSPIIAVPETEDVPIVVGSTIATPRFHLTLPCLSGQPSCPEPTHPDGPPESTTVDTP